MVQPVLECDIKRLQEEFVHGYIHGFFVFYLSVTNEQGETEKVSNAKRDAWGPLWQAKNEAFNAKLNETLGPEQFQGSKFFVCDGNHRLLA